jgi:hypothetical protein
MAYSRVNEMSNSKSNNNYKRNSIFLEEFSKEIHIAIASFLGVDDVVNYQCNKQLRRMINLHRLDRPSSIDVIDSESQYKQGVDDKIHLKQIIGLSFYFSNLIHSVKFSCYYKDQGWGNRKGNIFITEKPNQEQHKDEKDQEQKRRCCSLRRVDDDIHDDDEEGNNSDDDIGRIIAKSPLAEHHETKCELIFRPKPGFTYCLCYKVGGGGGHCINVRDIKLESFVHSACIPLANILMDTTTSQSSLLYMKMLQYVLDTVVYFDNSETEQQQQQQQQQEIRRPSLSFFRSVGLNLMDEHDIEAVRMLLAELESD